MASLQFPPSPSFSLPPSFLHHFSSSPPTFSHFSSNPKPFSSPHPSTISFSSPPRPITLAAATSFPYSQLQHRQYLKQHDSSTEPRSGDFKEQRNDDVDDDDELILGDSVVFEEGAFEEHNPCLPINIGGQPKLNKKKISNTRSDVESHSLVPEKWKEVVDEINLTKKEKRKIAHQLRFGSRLEGRKKTPGVDIEEYNAYRSMKLSQLNPVVLDNPDRFPPVTEEVGEVSRGRVAPRNPRLEIDGGTLEDITEFFNSGNYVPGERYDDKKPQGRRKLFTDEEKVLLNKRIPNLLEATSSKWLPLHALASSGEFYLLDLLLKHNVDINAVDEGGLAAIHKAILSKKHAITSYLLRNSANPFVRDMDDATLMHYAVLTASSASIKLLVLYNVDINGADNDGWTPLHLAVQTQRTDIVRLLLIKGADRTLKNQDGLTPLDMCLYCGHNVRTYEIIKLLKDTKSMSHA